MASLWRSGREEWIELATACSTALDAWRGPLRMCICATTSRLGRCEVCSASPPESRPRPGLWRRGCARWPPCAPPAPPSPRTTRCTSAPPACPAPAPPP
eukprot:4917957-Pyramimonas_sp.AAC.1